MAETTITKHFIEKHLFDRPDMNVYAILDGASVPDLPQVLWEMEPNHVCLYRGDLEVDMASVAPYLVGMQQGHPFTDWVLTEGWGNHWGIFAVTPHQADMKTMRLHFRKFLMVSGPDNKPLYFRYYDPRVMRVYLPTCFDEEIEIVFGPILEYIMEDDAPNGLVKFALDADKIRTQKITLKQ
jgi:hypothetical protein